ncbi:MAG TPA: NAD-dependent epimerase/dehydratase family protein, partial [Elusimicrobiota bacterium]|nr:NAD-dependent epimerase/dehydratase family protein [Elusimicrobiota bacterium]
MSGVKTRPEFLVTGIRGGLGRFLHERLGGAGLSRETGPEIERAGADAIVHCASAGSRCDEEEARRDILELTIRLLAAPHSFFVYISTVDVYPKDGRTHGEDERPGPESASSPYARSKLLAEEAVRSAGPAHLILRPGSLLGAYARPSSLVRAAREDCALELSGDSEFNCVRHEDVLAFLRAALREGLRGTYNAVSAKNVTLAEAAALG